MQYSKTNLNIRKIVYHSFDPQKYGSKSAWWISRYKLLPKHDGSVYAKTLWSCHVLSWSYKELSSNLRMKFRSLLKALLWTVEIKSVVTRPGGDKLTPGHILFCKSRRASQRLEGNVRWAGHSHPSPEFVWALYHPPESFSGHPQPQSSERCRCPRRLKCWGGRASLSQHWLQKTHARASGSLQASFT